MVITTIRIRVIVDIIKKWVYWGWDVKSGLKNPNSQTAAINVFTVALKKSKSRKVIFLLGEVDTGFVIWHRAENYKQDVRVMLQQAVDNYKLLIKLASDLKFEIECLSTPLPTIGDDSENQGEVASLRKNVKASQFDRTKLTIDFNNEMERFCKKNNVKYYNLDKESLGENGIVIPHLLNNNPSDHHYDSSAYAKMIIKKFNECK